MPKLFSRPTGEGRTDLCLDIAEALVHLWATGEGKTGRETQVDQIGRTSAAGATTMAVGGSETAR
jgi:hypothetical protein